MNRFLPHLPSTAWAILAVLLSMLSVQSGSAVAKTLFPVAGPLGITALRTLFAAVVLLGVWRPWRGPALRGRRLAVVVAYGVSLGYMNLLFYLALQRLPLGIAVAIEFAGPFGLALLSSRRVTDFCWVGLAFAGLAGLAPAMRIPGAIDPIGVAYALSAGVCWALYIVFGQKAGALMPGGQAAALGMTAAAVATAPFGIAAAGPVLLSPAVLLLGLGVAILSSAIPFPLEMVALKRLPTRTFGVLMSLEPAFAALSGMALLGEELSLRQWAAIVSVIVASLGSTVTAARTMGVKDLHQSA